eukprot:1195853-Prorocentrum_minimum.AAC.1
MGACQGSGAFRVCMTGLAYTGFHRYTRSQANLKTLNAHNINLALRLVTSVQTIPWHFAFASCIVVDSKGNVDAPNRGWSALAPRRRSCDSPSQPFLLAQIVSIPPCVSARYVQANSAVPHRQPSSSVSSRRIACSKLRELDTVEGSKSELRCPRFMVKSKQLTIQDNVYPLEMG